MSDTTFGDGSPASGLGIGTRTLADYVKMFRHVAPGWDDDAIDPKDAVNDALLDLATEWDWNWLHTETAAIGFVAGQTYAVLPSNFGHIVSITHPSTGLWMVCPTSIDHIATLRASYVQIDTAYLTYYALGGFVNSVPPQRKLEIWPTPGTTNANALTLHYRKLPQVLSLDTDVPDIPRICERALIHKVRAYAYELADNNFQSSDHIAYERAIEKLKYHFGMQQSNRGVMKPGTPIIHRDFPTTFPGEVVVPDITP